MSLRWRKPNCGYVTQWSVPLRGSKLRVASLRVVIAKTKIATLKDATANTSYPTGRLRQRNDELFYIYLDAPNLWNINLSSGCKLYALIDSEDF